MTGNIFYAITFLKNKDHDFREEGYLIKYWLKERVNIFNARYQKDYQKLEDYCRIHHRNFLSILTKLKDYDWLDILNFENREYLINILKTLGYDGFFNIENNQGNILRKIPFVKDKNDLYGFSGLGIFNEECLNTYEVYHGWKELTSLNEVQSLIKEAKRECVEKAIFVYEKIPQIQKLLEEKSPNKIKKDLAEKIIIESFLPYFLMKEEEIYNFVYTFDFKKEIKKIEKRFKENYRNSFNVFNRLNLSN